MFWHIVNTLYLVQGQDKNATEMKMDTSMKIGALADRTNCQVETIRFYEREGLLPEPARSEGNYRLYNSKHAERLSFIRRCRTLDMTLDEIRSLLHFKDQPDSNCGEVNALLDKHIVDVANRMSELETLREQLVTLRTRCRREHASKNSGILNELAIVGGGETKQRRGKNTREQKGDG